MSDLEKNGSGEARAERRRHPRKKPQALVYLDLGPSNGGMVRDVSEGGIGFRAVAPMRAGEKVKFTFAFDGSTRLEGECELVWTDEDGKAGGLRFTELSAELRDAVRRRMAAHPNHGEPVVDTTVPATTPLASMDDIRREIRQPSGRARRLARMLAEPAPAEQAQREPATPAAMLLPRAAEVTEEIKPEIQPQIRLEPKPEIRPDTTPEIRPEITSELSPESLPEARLEPSPAVWPAKPLLRAADIRVSEEALESRDEEMPGARWLEAVTLGRAVAAMLMLTLLAAGYVYHRALGESLIWLGQQIAGEDTPVTEGAAPPPSQQPTAEAPAEVPTPTRADREPERAVETAQPSNSVPAPVVVSPPVVTAAAGRDATAPATAAPAANSDGNGQPEFLKALQILRGKKHSGELPEAVRLLWVAFAKGNSGAAVALADLYRRGEGVPQNCEQTRVLLDAAAKKGNTEAKKRLAQLDQEGCP
jgi:PilZ domain-containing protein